MKEKIDTLFENSRKLVTPNKVLNEKDLKRKSNKIINIQKVEEKIEEIRENLNEEIYAQQKASKKAKIFSFIIPPIGIILFLKKYQKKPAYAKKCLELSFYSLFILFVIGIVISTIFIYKGINKTDEEVEKERREFKIYSEKNLELDPIKVETEEVKKFNKQIEAYEGNDVEGERVKRLYRVVDNHNTHDKNYKIIIIYNEKEIEDFMTEQEQININKIYKVKGTRNDKGLIQKITIEDN